MYQLLRSLAYIHSVGICRTPLSLAQRGDALGLPSWIHSWLILDPSFHATKQTAILSRKTC